MTTDEHRADSVEPLPTGWRLRMDDSTRIAGGGTVVFGGSPLRVLRLSKGGAEIVNGWREGRPVGSGLAERRLARRLVDAGLTHPEPTVAADPAQLTVVVPVRDRPLELARCLAALDDRSPVVVVDDASEDATAIAAVAGRAGASLIRLDGGRGAAAARNAGLRAVATPFVAFVDSDCVVGPGFPGRLLDHLGDPALAVAVPRIVAMEPEDARVLAAYEARRSSLDMGPREALVRPGSAVSQLEQLAVDGVHLILVGRAVRVGGGVESRGPGAGVAAELEHRQRSAGLSGAGRGVRATTGAARAEGETCTGERGDHRGYGPPEATSRRELSVRPRDAVITPPMDVGPSDGLSPAGNGGTSLWAPVSSAGAVALPASQRTDF